MLILRTFLFSLVLAAAAQAGVLRVITYPVRVSPVHLVKKAAKVVTYPVRHPKRFWVSVPVQHGPTLPPDPIPDGSRS